MYRLALAAICVGLLRGQTKQSPQEILKEAVSFHQQGKFAEAIRDYQLLLDMYPQLSEIRSNLGAALASTGRYSEAIGEYKRALADKPDPKVQLNLALAYYKAADLTNAAHELEAVRNADPANVQAVMLLADCDLRLGENKKVIELLTPLSRTNPNDLGVAYMLGTALVRDGQAAQGQVVINPILNKGDSAEARLLMGTTKFTARDFPGALVDLKKAVEMNPDLPDVYTYYGLALLSTGDTSGSKKAFEEELKRDPNNFEANMRMGFLLKEDQEYDRALACLQRAAQLRPGDVAVRFQIASVMLAKGKQDQAREDLEAIVKASPSFTEAHVTLATIYYREKRKQDGDRERAIVQKLNAERQAEQPAVKATQ